MNQDQLTIAIPVFNRENLLGRTLNSISAQTYRPFRVVLVDNGSTDSSLEIMQRWKEENESENLKITVLRELSPGACAARNAALKIIETPWTMFFDSDDTLHRDHIAQSISSIEKHPESQIIAWSRRIHTSDNKIIKKHFSKKNLIYSNLIHTILSTQSYMARTELFRAVGEWDESVLVGQDLELGHRLLLCKPRIIHLKNLFVDVYDTAQSITNTTRMRDYVFTMSKIREALPENKRHWADLQLLIKLASRGKADPEAKPIADRVFEQTRPGRRLLWRLLYNYQRLGGRGVGRIYALLHLNRMDI